MVFSSVTFLLYFLPIFMASYFLTPTIRGKNLVALAFSLVFYGWGEPLFLFVLLGSIAMNTMAALAIDKCEGRERRAALTRAIIANLALLGVFKYAGFIVANIDWVLSQFGAHIPVPRIALPLGISFFTFHCLSYLIDVYRKRFAAERDPSIVALYISLFPQLVAGPIVRYKTVARQLRNRHHTLGRASEGARIFIVGLAQKVLVADQVGQVVEALFDRTPVPTFGESWIGLFAYTVQIYFDFAGYSNMAVGLGLCLGFTLPRNFRLPYTSFSITEFWRRWHMSLSSWLRDYLYIPLGGNRGSKWQTYRNLATVFLLCGFWHGASWTFVLWGAWHGLFLILERVSLAEVLQRIPNALQWLYAMLVVMGGWVLFRAPDVAAALSIYRGLSGFNGMGSPGFEVQAELQPLVILALVAGGLFAILPRWVYWVPAVGTVRSLADTAWIFGLLLLALVWVGAGTYSPFLYFRF